MAIVSSTPKKKKPTDSDETLGLGVGATSVTPPRVPPLVEGGALGSLSEQAMEKRRMQQETAMPLSTRQGLMKKKRQGAMNVGTNETGSY